MAKAKARARKVATPPSGDKVWGELLAQAGAFPDFETSSGREPHQVCQFTYAGGRDEADYAIILESRRGSRGVRISCMFGVEIPPERFDDFEKLADHRNQFHDQEDAGYFLDRRSNMYGFGYGVFINLKKKQRLAKLIQNGVSMCDAHRTEFRATMGGKGTPTLKTFLEYEKLSGEGVPQNKMPIPDWSRIKAA